MSSYPLEGFLRPRFENYAICAHTLAIVIFLTIPEYLLLSPTIGQGFALISAIRIAIRFIGSRRIGRYQKRLWRYQKHTITPKQLSRHPREDVLIGIGFRWLPIHTQRLYDIISQSTYGYRPQWHINLYRGIEKLKPLGFLYKLVYACCNKPAGLNPLANSEPPNDTGNAYIHNLGASVEKTRPLYLTEGQRVSNLMIFGSPGVGKTRLLELIVHQDIMAGMPTIVIDPKGDHELLLSTWIAAVEAERANDFHLFHVSFPDQSSSCSLVSTFTRATEVPTQIADQLPDQGQSAAFQQFVWRFVNLISQIMIALGDRVDIKSVEENANDIEPLSLRYLRHHLSSTNHRRGAWESEITSAINDKQKTKNAEYQALRSYYSKHKINDPLASRVIQFLSMESTYRDKLVGSLFPFLQQLSTGEMSTMIVQPETPDRRVFSMDSISHNKGIVFIGLDSVTDKQVAKAIVSMMVSEIASTVGHIYSTRTYVPTSTPSHTAAYSPWSLIIDEFELALKAPQMVDLLNKGRGSKLRITGASQTRQDIDAGTGDPKLAEQALGNFGNIISFRVQNPETGEVITDKMGEVNVLGTMPITTVRDGSEEYSGLGHFQSSNEDRVIAEQKVAIPPSALTQLPVGETFGFIGGHLFSCKVPLLQNPSDCPELNTLTDVVNYITNQQRQIRQSGEQSA